MNDIIDTYERFKFLREDCKRYFGQWDAYDPVCWAILRVVEAQNDFAYAIGQYVDIGADKRMIEEAIAERIKAIGALQEAIKRHPRGPFDGGGKETVDA